MSTSKSEKGSDSEFFTNSLDCGVRNSASLRTRANVGPGEKKWRRSIKAKMKRKQRGRERKSLATERERVELKREIMPSVAQLVGNNGLTFGRRNKRGKKSDQTGVKPSRTQRFSKD